MFEKLRFKSALKSKSKEFNCKQIAESITKQHDMDFAWLIEAATNTIYVKEKSIPDDGVHVNDYVMQVVQDSVKTILTDDHLEKISSNICAMCSQGDLPDGDTIFDSLCESEGLLDKIKAATGSLIAAIVIALIIKVIIWAIIYWWWNKKQ